MSISQTVGEGVDWLGSQFNLKDYNISEKLAGGPTSNTAWNTGFQPQQSVQPQQSTQPFQTQLPSGTTNPGTGGTGEIPTGGTPPGDPTSPEEVARSRAEREALDKENSLRGVVNETYDTYIADLDDKMGDLSGQVDTQEQRVEGLFTQGQSDLTAQRTQGEADLSTQRRKTTEGNVASLNDISENIRNLFRSGRVALGARGAGDSSAVGQYQYAIGKLGAKERGKVQRQTRSIMSDIDDRSSRLQNIYMQETSKLLTQKNDQVLQITQWYQDQVQAIKDAKREGRLAKGQTLAEISMQLLTKAQTELTNIDTANANRKAALEQWAMNQSDTIGELKSNMQQISGYEAQPVQAQQFGNIGQPLGPSGNQTSYNPGKNYSGTKDDLFEGQYSTGGGGSW